MQGVCLAVQQSMKTAVKEVLSATQGADAWEDVDLDTIDLDDVLRRFETLRAMKFSNGSLNTYQGRFQRSLKMFEEFRASPSTWRPSVKQRSGKPTKAEGAPQTTSSAGTGSPTTPQVVAPPGASAEHGPHRATIITYPFPIRDGVLASIQLPADLRDREARRLSAFIDSLAIVDMPVEPVRGATRSPVEQTE